jgi:hypothetical protein
VPEDGVDLILWSLVSLEDGGFHWACRPMVKLEEAAVEDWVKFPSSW